MLCGFRPSQEIVANLTGHPEVLALVDQALLARLGRGAEEDQGKRDALRGIFSTIWKLENVQQKTVIDSVVARLQKNESQFSNF
jgi:hypothetical protein